MDGWPDQVVAETGIEPGRGRAHPLPVAVAAVETPPHPATARTIALIFAPDDAAVSLVVGGIGILERQTRQLRRVGVTVILAVDVVPLTPLPAGVEAIAAAALPGRIEGGDRVIIMSAGVIIDERAIAAVLAGPVPALLVDPATGDAAASARGVERIDATAFASGLMAMTGAAVLGVARGIGEWDLASTLIRTAAADPRTARLSFADLPLYAPARRREVPLVWARPETAADAAAVTGTLIAASQKGCLDWPARFLHPWPEDLLVRWLAPTPITPNMVTLATGVVGVVAGVAFALGHLWVGLILAIITGPLDGVDGKLARTRVEFSKWGDLEHLVDKLLEYGWYLAIAWHFWRTGTSALPWAIAAMIILPAIAEAVQGEFFRRLTGKQLDDAGPTERRIRLFAGRRNTFLWTWLPFAIAGLWFQGFVALAIYSVVTTGVAQWRFYKRLSAYARAHGDRIAANYVATGYTFLPPTSL